MSRFTLEGEATQLSRLVEALQEELTRKPRHVRHDYAKGAWFEPIATKSAIEIDFLEIPGVSLPLMPIPEQMGDLRFERLGVINVSRHTRGDRGRGSV